jgi:hypothetical protein
MDKLEQRFAMKLLFIKGLRSQPTHTTLEATLGATVCSLTQVKKWVGQLKTGGFSCQKQSHTVRSQPKSFERDAIRATVGYHDWFQAPQSSVDTF